MKRLFSVIALSALGACTTITTPAGSDRLQPGYSSGGIRWDDGTLVYVYARALEQDGKTRVCGSWMVSKGGTAWTSNLHDEALAAGKITSDGTTLVTGLSFLQRIDFTERLGGQPASCVLADVAWDPSFGDDALKISFPRMTFSG